jgi:flagellar hook-length control protein FliK
VLQTLKPSTAGIPVTAAPQTHAAGAASQSATAPKPPAPPAGGVAAQTSGAPAATARPAGSGNGRSDADSRGREQNTTATPAAIASPGPTTGVFNADAADGSDAATAAQQPQDSGSTATLAAQGAVADAGAVTGGTVDQVAGGLAMNVRSGQTEATISLRPAALGEVKIQVTSSQNGLVIRMAAERDSVGELLRSRLGELRELLAGRQVAVAELHVLHNPPAVSGRDGPSERQDAWQERAPRRDEDATQGDGGQQRNDEEQADA